MPDITVDANDVIDALQRQVSEGARQRAILEAQVALLTRENADLRTKIGETHE